MNTGNTYYLTQAILTGVQKKKAYILRNQFIACIHLFSIIKLFNVNLENISNMYLLRYKDILRLAELAVHMSYVHSFIVAAFALPFES